MAAEPHYIDVDLKKSTHYKTTTVTQNDTDVVFILRVSDDGRSDESVLDKFSTVTLTSQRRDGQSFYVLGEKIPGTNEVRFALGTKELELTGKVSASAQLYSVDGRQSSAKFNYNVEGDLTGDYVPTETEATLIEIVLMDGPATIAEAEQVTAQTVEALELLETEKTVAFQELDDVKEDNKLTWKPEVATVALRNSTYPNPQNGDTVRITEEARIDRFNGTEWITTDRYNPAAVDQLTAQLAETGKSITSFGAKADFNTSTKTGTDNTLAISQAVASLAEGEHLLIPAGDYLITNLVIDLPNDCSITFLGTLWSASPGVAVQFGSYETTRRRNKINEVKIKSTILNWEAGRVGALFVNLNEANIDIREVNGFEENVITLGINGKGFVHNELHLGLLMNGKVLFHTKESDTGWNNENVTFMGRFAWGSVVLDQIGCVGILEDAGTTYGINNNRYLFPSFEGKEDATPAIIGGTYTKLDSPRIEGVGKIQLTSKSSVCTITGGRGLRNNRIVDSGKNNKVYTQETFYWSGGTLTEDEGVVVIQNTSSGLHKSIKVLDPLGVELFTIRSNGQAYFKESIEGRRFLIGSGKREIIYAASSPQGSVSAPPGSICMNGTSASNQELWVKSIGSDANGWKLIHAITSGGASKRPVSPPIGFPYFDSVLGKPLWYNGTSWVDSNGVTV